MDPFTMALMGGTSLLSGGLSFLGSQKAAKAQEQAAQTSGMYGLIAQQQALAQAREMAEKGAAAAGQYYGKGREDVLGQAGLGEAAGREFYGQGVGYQQPYMGAGAGATNQLSSLYGPGGEYTRQPTMEELQFDPGYQFRFGQGMRALNAGLGASGMRGSGTALKAATQFGQDMASQEYQNAYNRFMANRAQAVQGLQNLSGIGAASAGTASQLAGQFGTNLMSQRFGAGSNLGSLASNAGATTAGAYTGVAPTLANIASGNPMGQAIENAGQARASGYMGGATALSQALQSIPQNYMMYNMMNRYAPSTPYAGFQGAPTYP
jgi:hypothetical protein